MHLRTVILVVALGLSRAASAQSPAMPPHMDQRVQACTLCHGKEGRATPGGFFPRIAGKPADYLYHQLLNFRDGRRNNDGMRYLLDHLSDDYLRLIAQHFASLDLPYPPPLPPQAAPPIWRAARRWCAAATRRASCQPAPPATARP